MDFVFFALGQTTKRSRVVTLFLINLAKVGMGLAAEADDGARVRRHCRSTSRIGWGDEIEMLEDFDFDGVDDEVAWC